MKIFFQSPLGIALITLVAGIIGGFTSHILQRRSQYKAWVLENRIKTFAEFLKTYSQCMDDIKAYLKENPNPIFDDRGISPGMFDVFGPAFAQLRIVRLLLDKDFRDRFEQLVADKILILCRKETFNNAEKASKSYNEIDNDIQNMLEQQLDYSDFFTRLRIFFDGP